MLDWLKDRFRRGPVVPVVRLSGVIASSGLLGNRSLSIETVAPLLKRAFDMRGAKAVALAINSPGGSPVQSALLGINRSASIIKTRVDCLAPHCRGILSVSLPNAACPAVASPSVAPRS